MASPIFLDHNATTPLDPRVKAAMDAFLEGGPGNPHSVSHALGWRAREAVDEARRQVAGLIGARPEEIVFTSGASEANNLAIQGAVEGRQGAVLCSAIEHPSVLEPVRHLASRGFRCGSIPVSSKGLVDPDALSENLFGDTLLVAVMAANNEIGTLQPVAGIGRLCRARGILFHCDAAQAAGKVPLDVAEIGCDFMSLSAHKLYGPMGIGALYVRQGARLSPVMHGGAQERSLRPGTVPAPLAVGFGEAARLAAAEMDEEAVRLRALRDALLEKLRAGLPGLRVNGSLEHRLAGNLNLRVEGADAEDWLLNCPGLALSTGSACASGRQAPSEVLQALGLSVEAAAGSIRIGLGRFTTAVEVDQAAAELCHGLMAQRGG